MADTLQRRSPLQPWAAQFARLPNSVAIVEEPFVTMVDLRVGPFRSGAVAAAELLGVELPTAASTYAKNADTTVIWLCPDEWLVTGTALVGPELEARLREAVAPHDAPRSTCRGSAPRRGCAARTAATCWPRGARWICIHGPSAREPPRRRWSAKQVSSCWRSTEPVTTIAFWCASPSPGIWPIGCSTRRGSTHRTHGDLMYPDGRLTCQCR